MLAQRIEGRDHEPAVDPADDPAAQRDQPFEMQVAVFFQYREFVRAEIEIEVVLRKLRGERNRQFGFEGLDFTLARLERGIFDRPVLEVVLSNEDR